jgi:hypothetical protein
MLTRNLELIFLNAAGKKVTVTVPDPLETLSEAEVQAAMSTIVTKNVFTSSGGDLVAVSGARLVTREVADLITSQ